MPGGRLPRRETELTILRVATLARSDYELAHDRHLGRRGGLLVGRYQRLATTLRTLRVRPDLPRD